MKLNIKGSNEVFYATKFSAGFDIKIAEDVKLYPQEIKLVSTGLYLDVDVDKDDVYLISGFVPCLLITPRSGTAKKGLTLANTPAIIDYDYKGEIKLLLANISNNVITVEKDTRVAQGLWIMVYRPKEIKVVDKERGAGGFGSTGIN